MSPRTIRVTASIMVPRTPNFLRFEDPGHGSIPIEDVAEKDLRKIGKLWTEELIERAEERRNRPHE